MRNKKDSKLGWHLFNIEFSHNRKTDPIERKSYKLYAS